MQVLKDEIKEKIVTAAIAEFKEKGFLQASMRSIAKNSGMTVGNIYRYFPNKEQLFHGIVDPAYTKVVHIIEQCKSIVVTKEIEQFNRILMESLLNLFHDYRDELQILIDGAEGTQYHNITEQVIEMVKEYKIEEAKKYSCFQSNVVQKDEFIQYTFDMISSTFIQGIVKILRAFKNEEEMCFMLGVLIRFCFSDLEKRL